jgi:hypothetical protein
MLVLKRNFLFILLFVLSNINVFAQLGFSEQQTIKEQGKYFKREIEDGTILLYYKTSIVEQGKSYSEIVLYKIDQESNICYGEMYTSSIKAVNIYINNLNKMGKQIDVRTWEDPKNNSVYKLTTEGNIASIAHSFKSSESNRIVEKQNTEITTFKKELLECKNDNQNLLSQIDFLKKMNSEIINNITEMTQLTEKGAINIEKAIESMKEKDAKILLLQEALAKKDSVMHEYIRKLEQNQKR